MGLYQANTDFSHGGVQIRKGHVIEDDSDLYALFPTRFTVIDTGSSGASGLAPLHTLSGTATQDGNTVNQVDDGVGELGGVAFGWDNEAHPRVLLRHADLSFGDGTADPTTQASFYYNNDSNVGFLGNLQFEVIGTGIVLTSANNSQHRLVVANDGTLSTVPFP